MKGFNYKNMRFSFIIINYKTPDLTIQCLKSIFNKCLFNDYEIILIDNNSQDDSIRKIKKEFNNKIKIIENKENTGFAKANNQGAKIAQGQYLFFLNSDTIITRDILNEIEKIFLDNKKIGIISPILKLTSGQNQRAAFGIFPTFFKLITQKTKIELIPNENKELFECDWVSGCALTIKHDLFNKIKGWDENFFLYYEDIDICKQINLIGYKSVMATKINLIHLGGQSLKMSPFKRKIYYQSQDYYFKKYYNNITCLLIKIFRFFYSLIIKYEQ